MNIHDRPDPSCEPVQRFPLNILLDVDSPSCGTSPLEMELLPPHDFLPPALQNERHERLNCVDGFDSPVDSDSATLTPLEVPIHHEMAPDAESALDGRVEDNRQLPGNDERPMRNHRRRIDEILPGFLYLGGGRAAQSYELVKHHDIDALLACARDAPLPPFATVDSTFDTLHLQMADAADTELESHFGAAFEFLDAMREAGKRVLVYCREGKSRSASIVIAYLIRTHKLDYGRALEHVRAARKEVDPNFSFCSQLSRFSNSDTMQALLQSKQTSCVKTTTTMNADRNSRDTSVMARPGCPCFLPRLS